MRYGKRRPPPFKLIGIIAGVAVIAVVGGVFWFASQAESHPPAQAEIRVEAKNVGPN
jgi:flagellar basal body-associated protein FliL